MTITMYSQQKLTQKLTKAKNPPKPAVDDQGRPILDQQAQMQKMMGFMMFFMGFIFYNFPSGLNLYILTSNLVGMLEQWQIRKHIKEKDDRGDFDRGSSPGPKPGGSGKPTFIQRLQKKAEEARLTKTARPATPRKKKQRF